MAFTYLDNFIPFERDKKECSPHSFGYECERIILVGSGVIFGSVQEPIQWKKKKRKQIEINK